MLPRTKKNGDDVAVIYPTKFKAKVSRYVLS